MTPDYATFVVLYPELVTATNQAAIALRLADNGDEMSEGAWGRCWAAAVLELTAHETALANAQVASAGSDGVVQASGVLQSGSEEGISFAFADMGLANRGTNAQWLAQTPYGLSLLARGKRCLPKALLSW